ncbi:unnamed protein product, partial [Prorocentrum cordatum]
MRSVIYGWCINTLVGMLGEGDFTVGVYRQVALFGFLPEVGCVELVAPPRDMLSRAQERHEESALSCFSRDALQALGFMRDDLAGTAPSKIAGRLGGNGSEQNWHAEEVDMQCLLPSPEEPPKTDGTGGTAKWNAVARLVFGVVLPHRSELRCVSATGKWRTHACHADSWSLYVASFTQRKPSSLCVLTPVPGGRNWQRQIPQAEDEVFAARWEVCAGVEAAAGSRALTVRAVVGTWTVLEVEEAMVLGALLRRLVSIATAVQHRERLAVKTFYTMGSLRSRDVSLKRRLARYSETVPATLLSLRESWVFANSLVLRLKCMEGGMRRKMASVRKKPGQP